MTEDLNMRHHTLRLTDNQLLVLLAVLHQNAVMLPLAKDGTEALVQRYRAALPRGWWERLPGYAPTEDTRESLPEEIGARLRHVLMTADECDMTTVRRCDV